MTWTPSLPNDDDEDSDDPVDGTLEDLGAELTGAAPPAGDAAAHEAARLREEELEGLAGVESPPDRID